MFGVSLLCLQDWHTCHLPNAVIIAIVACARIHTCMHTHAHMHTLTHTYILDFVMKCICFVALINFNEEKRPFLVTGHKQNTTGTEAMGLFLCSITGAFIYYAESAVWLVDDMPSNAPRVSGDLLQVKGYCRLEVKYGWGQIGPQEKLFHGL